VDDAGVSPDQQHNEHESLDGAGPLVEQTVRTVLE
jgi:hypothetical protein